MSVNAGPPDAGWHDQALGGQRRRRRSPSPPRRPLRAGSVVSRPLDGILVVSLEQAIAAPYCTRLLADQGARVIKVERPDGGDFARAYDKRARGLASHFVWTNRSKESLALDLKEPAAIDDAAGAHRQGRRLRPEPRARRRRTAGPRPGGRSAQANPRLVTCSISGYGEGGPYDERKAYDLLIQAEAGFLSVTGTERPDGQGRHLDRRHRERRHRLQRDPRRAPPPRADGPRATTSRSRCWRRWPSGWAFRCTSPSTARAPPPRAGAGHATIYPYGPYATADGDDLLRPPERPRMGGLRHPRARAPRPRRRPALQGQCRPRRPPRRARADHHRRALGALADRGGACRGSTAPASPPRASTTWRRCGRIRSLPRATAGASSARRRAPCPASCRSAARAGSRASTRCRRSASTPTAILAEFGRGRTDKTKEDRRDDPQARPPPGHARGAPRPLRGISRRSTTAATTRRPPIRSSSSTR